MSNNNRERLFNNSGPPPQANVNRMSIQEIVQMYCFLANVPNPTEKLTQTKDNFENIILEFSRSFIGTADHGQAN